METPEAALSITAPADTPPTSSVTTTPAVGTAPQETQKIEREKYSYRWYNYCKKRPKEPECILDNFKEKPDSFTTIMGLQDEAKPGKPYPYNQITRYDKFVPAQHISLRRSGEFPNGQYCTELEAAIKDHTDNLIHVAHSGRYGDRLDIDYHFLTYLDYDKLSQILEDNFPKNPIPWKPVPETEIASREFDLRYPKSIYRHDGSESKTKRPTIARPQSGDKSRKLYEKFNVFTTKGKSYELYDLKSADPERTGFESTVFGGYHLNEFRSYFTNTGIRLNGSALDPYALPAIRLLDFIDNEKLYFLGHNKTIGSKAPNILDVIHLYEFDPSRAPNQKNGPLSHTPHCSIEFIFKPNQ